MGVATSGGRTQADVPAGHQVLVVGAGPAFAEALTSLMRRLGLEARYASDIRALPEPAFHPIAVVLDAGADQPALVEAGEALRERYPSARLFLLAGSRTRIQGQNRLAADVGAEGWILPDTDPATLERGLLKAGAAPLSDKATTPYEHGARRLDNLTRREREILGQLVSGDNNQRIGQRLGISPHTVRTHVQNILAKLGVGNRIEAATFAVQAGMRPPARLGAIGGSSS